MKIYKGIPNQINIEVNEMNENLVHANGQKDSQFQVYFSGESYIADTPYFNQTFYNNMLFDATIQYQF